MFSLLFESLMMDSKNIYSLRLLLSFILGYRYHYVSNFEVWIKYHAKNNSLRHWNHFSFPFSVKEEKYRKLKRFYKLMLSVRCNNKNFSFPILQKHGRQLKAWVVKRSSQVWHRHNASMEQIVNIMQRDCCNFCMLK